MKRLIAGILLIILLAGMLGCSKTSEPVTVVYSGSTSTAPVVLAPPAVEQQRSIFGLGGKDEQPPVVITQVPAPVINIPAPTPAPTTVAAYGTDQSTTAERMIIRNGYIQLVVLDVTQALKEITNLAATYGGFVVNSDIQEDQNRMYGNISVRVLSDHFNDALAALRAMAVDVRSESTSGQDVTEEYTDLGANLRNLEAAEAQLLNLMEQAGKVTDILEVQRELVKTRGEIERTKGRMQYLEQSSSLAFIQVTLEQSKLTVEFTAATRNVKEGERIRFNSTVAGGFKPYSYAWDFGDGQTSTDNSPIHAYRNDGTFTVSLNVTDDRGNTVSSKRDNYITVLSGWEAGNTASSAWNGFVGFMHFLVNLIIWLGIFSPVWIVVLVILYFTWWRRRKKAK